MHKCTDDQRRQSKDCWLDHYLKGKMKGRQGRRKKARQMVGKVAATGNGDPVATILKVKHLAAEVGGMKKLKALVDVLSE